MDLFKSYLTAQNIAEHTLIAHHASHEKRAYHIETAHREFRTLAERMGYAKLCAAAPDLLDALKEFVHPHQSGDLTERELREKALAAIAKAEGKE